MKKLIAVSALFLCSILTIQAQFGIKGGLNFATNGELKEVADDLTTSIKNPDSKTGYHIGVFYQTKGDSSFYVRPELVYTKTKSDYAGTDFDMSKLDMPILLGFKVISPLSVFAGPAFQYIVNTDLQGLEIQEIKNDFTVGLHVGAAITLGDFGVDVRYEKGLSENIANFTDVPDTRLDTRPNQFIIGVSFNL